MPWKETVPMKERIKFISNYLEKNVETFSELCAFYGVSRKTGYKYVQQFAETGIDGLKDHSRAPQHNEPFSLCTSPNDVWSIDFKGQFYLGNKKRCYPLTVTDNFNGYLLDIRAFEGIKSLKTQDTLEKLFKTYGLPKAIKSDNGVPFASIGIAGLSNMKVSVFNALSGSIPILSVHFQAPSPK